MSYYNNIKYNTLPQQVEENRQKIADLESSIGGNLLDPEIFIIVSELPASGLANKIYLVPKATPELNDGYEEFIWKDGTWELLGSLTLDLSSKVNANNPITAGTKTKITYDTKGLVTGGSDLVASDIPQLAPSKIIQDANNRFVTDTEKLTWNGKQNALTAGYGISINTDSYDRDVISATGGEITVETWNTEIKLIDSSDANKLFVCSHTDNQSLVIHVNESTAIPIGTMITFLLTSTYSVTFSGSGGVTLTSIDSLVTLATQFAMASLIKTDTNTWQLVGALE